jgi:hypothetical protein
VLGEKPQRRLDESAAEPSRATSGRQALPPAASVSRTTAPASAALASFGSVLSAARKSAGPGAHRDARASHRLADRPLPGGAQQAKERDTLTVVPGTRRLIESTTAGARH